jgi:hypothetical protein
MSFGPTYAVPCWPVCSVSLPPGGSVWTAQRRWPSGHPSINIEEGRD